MSALGALLGPTNNSPDWDALLTQPRHSNATLTTSEIPKEARVYAWFQNDECVYFGKASSLRSRLGNHRSTSLDLSRSTLRLRRSRRTRGHPRSRPATSDRHDPRAGERGDRVVRASRGDVGDV